MKIAKTDTPKLGLRGTTRNLRFGLVNVGIKSMPATEVSARLSARMADPDGHGKVKQQYVNEAGDVVKPTKVYDVDGKTVELTSEELARMESTDTIALVANVEDVPSEWILSTAIAWPADESQREAFSLVSRYLAFYGRVMLGQYAANGTTKVVAIRWSDVYGTLVLQTLCYHAQVRWDKVEAIREYVEAGPAIADNMVAMAESIFGAIPGEFAWDTVRDEYGEALEAAVHAKAEGKALSQAVTAATAPAASDLMAALTASLAAA